MKLNLFLGFLFVLNGLWAEEKKSCIIQCATNKVPTTIECKKLKHSTDQIIEELKKLNSKKRCDISKVVQKVINLEQIMLNNTKDFNKTITALQKKLDEKDNYSTIFIPVLVAIIAGILALLQIKANIISNARVDWIHKFRETMSSLISESTVLFFNLQRVLILIQEKNQKDAEKLYHEQINVVKEVSKYGNQIKLFLNNKKEKKHTELEKKVEDFLKIASKKMPPNDKDILEFDKIKTELIKMSQELLKDVWEDAKKFHIKEILFNFKFK